MKYHTHIIIGATAGIIIAAHTGQFVPLFALIGGMAGVLPDADIYADKARIAEHRGAWSHSLLASLVAGGATFGILFYLGYNLMFSASLSLTVFSGFFLHALADTLTYSGTYLLYPISKRRYKGFVRYDNIAVNIFLILLCVVLLILFTPIADHLPLP